jgi:hypothetical protein
MRRRARPFPLLLAELAFASWQTIAYRMDMIARGTCTPAEYRRMVTEKLVATQRSAVAAILPGRNRNRALLAPWHRAAAANARRLGRRKRR